METAVRRLTRSRTDRVFGGVCGGFAEYVGWDAVMVRVAFVVLTVLSSGVGGVLLYLIAWVTIPLGEIPLAAVTPIPLGSRSGSSRVIMGVLLLVAGVIALMSSFLPLFWHWSHFRIIGPVALIAIGLVFLLSRRDVTETTLPGANACGGTGETMSEEKTTPRPAEVPRRLMRLRRGRKIAGVCAGIGDYLDIDPTIVRLVAILLLLMGAGLLLYIIMWVVMPLQD